MSIDGQGYYFTGQDPEDPDLLDPHVGLAERIMRGDQRLWVPEGEPLANLSSTERKRYKLAASRVLEMADAVELLVAGEDVFDVLDSVRYLLSDRLARRIDQAKQSAASA